MELENFESQIKPIGTGKLAIDFSLSDLEMKSNQIEVGSIKYKTKKKLSQETIDPRSRNKKTKNLF